MRILMLMALLLASLGWPTAATAAEGAMSAPRNDGLFQGTADVSEANLTALCATALPAGLLQPLQKRRHSLATVARSIFVAFPLVALVAVTGLLFKEYFL